MIRPLTTPRVPRLGLTLLRSAVAILALLAAVLPGVARADGGRVALVIGNGTYERVQQLGNPVADARAIDAKLRQMGFQSELRLDLKRPDMMSAVRRFGERAEGAEVALLFFAGHGMQMTVRDRVENFLLPVDAVLADERDVADETVSLDQALDRLSGAKNRIVLLDACRDNPFLVRMKVPQGSRGGASRGLGRTGTLGSGTLVAFATEPGQVALDGDGEHSPFTVGLLENLATPGQEVRLMLGKVRQAVVQRTSGPRMVPQWPFANDGLLTEVYLAGPPVAGINQRPDEAAWVATRGSSQIADFEAFIRTYPGSSFVPLARDRVLILSPARPFETGFSPAPGPGLGGQLPGSGPTRLTLEQMRQSARDTILRLYSTWSGDQRAAIAFVEKAYPTSLLLNGHMVKREDLVRIKLDQISRWPERQYTVRSDPFKVDCNQAASTCRVEGVVDRRERPAAGNWVSGTTAFAFSVAFPNGRPTIVAESGTARN